MSITITRLPDSSAVPAPDTVWDGFSGDFAPVSRAGQGPLGGLRGGQELATAVMMCLFTDRAADEGDLRMEHRGDRRGWIGDGFDLDRGAREQPLGSRWWLMRREVLSDELARRVEDEGRMALQPLVDQGAVTRVDIAVSFDKPRGWLMCDLALYGKAGGVVFAKKFNDLWGALDGLHHPLAV